MGAHVGEVTEGASGLVGLELHRAARIAAVGHGGQVLLSSAAAALVRNGLPPGASLRDLGEHRLKDLGRAEQIFQLEHEDLQHEFPPLRSLDNPALPNNLPAQSSNFVGRDGELAELRSLVGTGRLVTLTGAGGSGKTRLSLQVAAELLDGSGDGVWLVELAAVTGDGSVASAICEVLGIAKDPGSEPLETLLNALGPQNSLLVLDNCEHLLGDCAKVADAVLRRCPHIHLLATSREPLGIGGEVLFRVPSMSLPERDPAGDVSTDSDAVNLFVDRATSQGVDISLDANTGPLLASICRRLDGMPLAIELAAARLRSMSLNDLSNRLDQRFRLLTGGSRSALPRQQTLLATVEWSYSLLNQPEQTLLQRLSLFADGFDLQAAEAVCGFGNIDVFDITNLLGSLVDKSLVVTEQSGKTIRYRLLETIRQFSVDRLIETATAEADAVADAHCAYYLHLAEEALPHLRGPQQGEWFAELDGEVANLRKAMEHAAAEPDATALLLRFCVALSRYLWVRTPPDDITRLFISALESDEASDDPGLLGNALVGAALICRTIDVKMARSLGEKGVAVARQLGDTRMLAQALSMVCSASYFAGDLAGGRAAGFEAVELARTLDDDQTRAQCVGLFLMCEMVLNPGDVVSLFNEAVTYCERAGDHWLASILFNNAGVQALQEGDTVSARAFLERSTQAGLMVNSVRINALVNMGWVLRAENEPNEARSALNEALRRSRRSGSRNAMAYSILGLACLATDAGDWHQALELHGTAQGYLDALGEQWQSPETEYRQASLDAARAHLGPDEFTTAYDQGLRAAAQGQLLPNS
jgi:predicted ATPase